MATNTYIDLPENSLNYHVMLHVVQEYVPVEENEDRDGKDAGDTNQEPGLDSKVYQNAYRAWRENRLADTMVRELFGDDWLMLFEVTKDGLGGDTLGLGEEGHQTASQLDEVSQGPAGHAHGDGVASTAPEETGGQWMQSLRPGETVILEETPEEGSLERD